MNLWEVAAEISRRLITLFQQGKAIQQVTEAEQGRPVLGDFDPFQRNPHGNQYLLFHEYFNGDDGAGLGASYPTGWTGLIAKLIQQHSEYG